MIADRAHNASWRIGEVKTSARKRVRFIDTPHTPHGWDDPA